MKKLIAMILGLVLILSMSTTAFAAGDQTGSTTITAEVPEPTYTIVIPADMTLEFNNTEKQTIGYFTVSDTASIPEGKSIMCEVVVQDLKCGTNTIPVTYFVDGLEISGSYSDYLLHSSIPGIVRSRLDAQVAAASWASAEPGTYTATITFNFSID